MNTRPTLQIADAERIGQAAAQHARQQGWAVSIAIVDDGGHPLWLLRLDGARPATVPVAQAKARTAALWGCDTQVFEAMLAKRPAFLGAPGFDCLMEGGVPLLSDGCVVGAVGVSGVRSEDDAAIARAGVAAA